METGTPLSLIVDSGRMAGQKFVLGASRFFLGRGPENGIVLPDPSISPRHAEFQRWNNQWWIADLGSATGTFVNERRLLKPVVLSPGDVIRLGNVRFRVLGIPPEAQAGVGPSVEPAPHRRDRPPGSQQRSRSAAAWLIAAPPLVAVVAILLLVWALGKDSARSPVPTVSHRAPEPLTTICPAPSPVPFTLVTSPTPPTPLAPASPTAALGTPSLTSLPGPGSASPPAPTPASAPPWVILGEPVYHRLNSQDAEFGWAREREQNVAWVLTLVLTPTSGISEILGPFFYARGKDGTLRQVTTYVQTPFSPGQQGTFLAFCREDEYIAKAVFSKDGQTFQYDLEDTRNQEM